MQEAARPNPGSNQEVAQVAVCGLDGYSCRGSTQKRRAKERLARDEEARALVAAPLGPMPNNIGAESRGQPRGALTPP
jgi:hypothetical protein